MQDVANDSELDEVRAALGRLPITEDERTIVLAAVRAYIDYNTGRKCAFCATTGDDCAHVRS